MSNASYKKSRPAKEFRPAGICILLGLLAGAGLAWGLRATPADAGFGLCVACEQYAEGQALGLQLPGPSPGSVNAVANVVDPLLQPASVGNQPTPAGNQLAPGVPVWNTTGALPNSQPFNFDPTFHADCSVSQMTMLSIWGALPSVPAMWCNPAGGVAGGASGMGGMGGIGGIGEVGGMGDPGVPAVGSVSSLTGLPAGLSAGWISSPGPMQSVEIPASAAAAAL